MITKKHRILCAILTFFTLPIDAYAKGGNGLILLVLIGLFAPVIAYFIEIWLLLGLTLLPMGIGLYILFTAKGDGGVLFSLLLIALGGFFTYLVAGKDIKRILESKKAKNH